MTSIVTSTVRKKVSSIPTTETLSVMKGRRVPTANQSGSPLINRKPPCRAGERRWRNAMCAINAVAETPTSSARAGLSPKEVRKEVRCCCMRMMTRKQLAQNYGITARMARPCQRCSAHFL